MMQDAVGAEKIVYNPYSLNYLLQSQAESSAYWQEYLECIQHIESKTDFYEDCNTLKPQFAIFEQQNVDVLQVISRCRENYNHKRWDEASILFALFSADEWLQNNLQASLSHTLDDKFLQIRSKMIDLMNMLPRSKLNLLIPQERASWYAIHTCLVNALHSGQMTNRCHLVDKSIEFQEKQFEYVIVQTQYEKLFTYIDACKVLSKENALSDGLLNATMPRYLWTGNSENSVPLAILHNENHQNKEKILAEARSDMEILLTEKIIPAFALLENNKLLESLQDQLTVASFSVEGDEITQLLDCFVMGPYASADLSFTIHSFDNTIPTPKYHRGDSFSRFFTSWGAVGGSNARQLFHSEVMAQIAEQGVNLIAAEAYNHFLYIRKLFLEPAADDKTNGENGLAPSLLCACDEMITTSLTSQQNVVTPSLECCYLNVEYGVWTRRTDIQFANLGYDVNRPIANIGSQVLDSAFDILVSQPESGLQWVQMLEKPTYGRARPVYEAQSTLIETLERKLTLSVQEVAALGIDDLQVDDYFYLQTSVSSTDTTSSTASEVTDGDGTAGSPCLACTLSSYDGRSLYMYAGHTTTVTTYDNHFFQITTDELHVVNGGTAVSGQTVENGPPPVTTFLLPDSLSCQKLWYWCGTHSDMKHGIVFVMPADGTACPDDFDTTIKYYMPKSNVFSRLLNGYKWEIGGSLQAGIYEQPVAQSEQEKLQAVKTAYASELLLKNQRELLSEHGMFRNASHQPVASFTYEDTDLQLGGRDIWTLCQQHVNSLFSSLPYMNTDEKIANNKPINESFVHVPLNDLKRALDGVFDQNGFENVAAFENLKSSTDVYNHILELVVDKILQQANNFVPTFWFKQHRYVASDSVFCEPAANHVNGTNVVYHTKSSHSAHYAQDNFVFKDIDYTQIEKIVAATSAEVVYPSDSLSVCACGWNSDAESANACQIPDIVCAEGAQLMRQSQSFADDEVNHWMQICSSAALPENYDSIVDAVRNVNRSTWRHLQASTPITYSTKDDLLLVLRVLDKSSEIASVAPAWNFLCDVTQTQLYEGYLHPNQVNLFYGADDTNFANQANEALQFDPQHVGTYGAGGTRIGQFSKKAEMPFTRFIENFDRGGHRRHTFAYHTKNKYWDDSDAIKNNESTKSYTVGQPVCNATLHNYLKQQLNMHFEDVFWPMAHSVQTGHGTDCARWAVEWSFLQILLDVSKLQSKSESKIFSENLETVVSEQSVRLASWEKKCLATAHSIAMCELRGMYDYENVPPSAKEPLLSHQENGCAWAGPSHSTSGCSRVFYTPGCLINCDDIYYDPCLCEAQNQAQGSACVDQAFSPVTCQSGIVHHGRHFIYGEGYETNTNHAGTDAGNVDDYLLLSSLQWPITVDAAECNSVEQWEEMQKSLRKIDATQYDANIVNLNLLLGRSSNFALHEIMQTSVQSTQISYDTAFDVHAYCDDLHDYWPSDAQHPLGYHPTSACDKKHTNTRGFVTWMTADADGNNFIDPVRARNATTASQVFGAAHLVCDIGAYASPNPDLRSLYMESRWNAVAKADASVPRASQTLSLDDMQVFGAPTFNSWHSTRRNLGHPADILFAHSVGLIRDWARSFTKDQSNIFVQQSVNNEWPNWVLVSENHLASYKIRRLALMSTANLADEADDMSTAASAGVFLSELKSRPAGCKMPPLRYCKYDSDCNNAFGLKQLVCLVNFHSVSEQDELFAQNNIVTNEAAGAEQMFGICAERGSCYQHKHCEAEEEKSMCMENGYCGKPEILFTNRMNMPVNIQVFSERCSVDTSRISVSEGIADFAQANGMCSFRNWYHYLNDTDMSEKQSADGQTDPLLLHVRDNFMHRTNRRTGDSTSTSQTFGEANVMMPLVDGCDMSYQHTSYMACGKQDLQSIDKSAYITYQTQPQRAAEMLALQPWVKENNEWKMQMCKMPSRELSSFLAPYNSIQIQNTVDAFGTETSLLQSTLKLAASEIFRCKESKECPARRFVVRGEVVEARQVQIQSVNANNQIVNQEPRKYRDYCGLDSQRCFGAGQLVGTDCVDITSGLANIPGLCVIDKLTNPLISVVFGNLDTFSTSEQNIQKMQEIRTHCKYAFTGHIENRKDEALFTFLKNTLSTPYQWRDTEAVQKVQKMANALLFAMFGIDDFGNGRGFTVDKKASLEKYLDITQCLAYIASEMDKQVQELEVAETQVYSPRLQSVFATDCSSSERSETTSTTQENTGNVGSVMPNPARLPGNSLYLFIQRTVVYMPIRWFAQCVLLAKNVEENGVSNAWIAQVLDGTIGTNTFGTDSDFDTEAGNTLTYCQNYITDWDAVEDVIPLSNRLRAEKFALTVEDNSLKNGMQVVKDLEDTVSWALNELGIKSEPDLYCVQVRDSDHNIELLLNSAGVFDIENEFLLRSNLPTLAALQYSTDYVKTANDLSTNLYHAVYEFLSCNQVINFQAMRDEWMTLTLDELLQKNIMSKRNDDELQNVFVRVGKNSKSRFALYEFTNLQNFEEKWQELQDNKMMCSLQIKQEEYLSQTDYIYDQPRMCTCPEAFSAPGCCDGKECRKETRRQLKQPEFFTAKLGCDDTTCKFRIPLLSKETLENDNLIARMHLRTSFLRFSEALKLVLILISEAFHNTVVGSLESLHISTDDNWKPLHELYNDKATGHDLDALDIKSAVAYNEYMMHFQTENIECQANSGIKYDVETNPNNMRLRECKNAMKTTIGWKLPADKTQVLRVPVSRDVLLAGFYPAFQAEIAEIEQTDSYAAKYFLQDLLSCTQSRLQENHICYRNGDDTMVMNPFWAEYFDVAVDMAEAGTVALGCDMQRSGKDNTIFVYDTVCTDDATSKVCNNHPNFANALNTLLPPVCKSVNGREIFRGRIGSMQGAAICDRKPSVSASCSVPHGTLHNIVGETISTNTNNGFMPKENTLQVAATQRGMWYAENYLFAANLQAPTLTSANPLALALMETDIGGHALQFEISESGTLALKHSYAEDMGQMSELEYEQFLLATRNSLHVNQKIGQRAQDWWSWSHAYELAKENEEWQPSNDISWQCPLWRMGIYHSNFNTHQARSPQRHRNQARFRQITEHNGLPNYFAHVTHQKISKIVPNMHAAHFISETIACTSDKTKCHSADFLQRSIDVQMSHEWNIMQFVPDLDDEAMLGECQQILDWPHTN